MSFKEYAQYVLHKYALAVAVGVIKSKPENITIEEHLNHLRTKIKETENIMDTNLDISICEDDFNMSDSICDDVLSNNSVSILKDFKIDNVEDMAAEKEIISSNVDVKDANSLLDVQTDLNNSLDGVSGDNNNEQSNLTQSTFFDESQCCQNASQFIELKDIDTNSTIFEDDPQNDDIVINNKQHYENKSQQESKSINYNVDSQQTILYTPYGFSNNHTDIGQSQDNITVTYQNLLRRSNNTLNDINYNEINQVSQNINKKLDNPINSLKNMIMKMPSKLNNKKEMVIKHKSYENDSNEEIKRTKINENSQTHKKSRRSFRDPENGDLFNTLDTNSFSKFSKESNEDSVKLSHNIRSLMQDSLFESDILILTPHDVSQDAQDVNIKTPILKTTSEKYPGQLHDNHNTSIFSERCFDINSLSNSDCNLNMSTRNYTFDTFENNSDKKENIINDYNQVIENNNVNIEESNENLGSHTNVSNNKRRDIISYDDCDSGSKEYLSWGNFQNIETESFCEIGERQSEIVSFKVLEELRKIRKYLDKTESGVNVSSDSGYKSFQPHSSYRSASQHSEVWINESSYCLFKFLMTHPVLETTENITDDISKVMGKLVDKLHEQMIYPKFVEELLEGVDNLLRDVYQGSNESDECEDNILLQKDEKIYRLLLLNRSLHVINYTIEKIIEILEETLSNLADEDFELTNTDKSENICYIFHILEVILKRNKYFNACSQMSEKILQDDDKILKKSSIAEIWRKKWNMTKDIDEGTPKKVCILSKCSEILNRVVVEAMDKYSLVSFAALQCFNLLQN